jgi:hypothetical protein
MNILDKAKEMKIVEEVEVDKTETVIEDTESKEVETVKELSDDDYVSTFSCFRGELNLTSRDAAEYDKYIYDGFLEMKQVRFGFLKSLRRMNSKSITKPMFYIADDQAIKQLRLETEYENILDPRELVDVLKKNTKELIEFIDNSDMNVKKMIRQLAMTQIENDELTHRGKIKVLSEKLNFKLND